MRLLFTILGKYAEILDDGTFTVVGGGMEGIIARHFPITIPSLSLLAKLATDPNDIGAYKLAVLLVNPAEQIVGPPLAVIPFAASSDPAEYEQLFLFRLHGLEIHQPGIHQFRINLMGGPDLGAVALNIEQQKGDL